MLSKTSRVISSKARNLAECPGRVPARDPSALRFVGMTPFLNKFNFIEFLPRSVKRIQVFLYIHSLKFGISLGLHYLCRHFLEELRFLCCITL